MPSKHEQIAEKFWRLFMRLNRAVDQRMSANGASLARTKLLLFLDRDGPVRSTDIADFFGYAKRTVTEALDALERDGMIARKPDLSDRRAKRILLTRRGKGALEVTEPLRQRIVEEVFGSVSEHRLRTFERVLDDLAVTLTRKKM